MSRRRPGPRARREKLRGGVRRVAQRAQLIAVEGKHRAVRVLIDVSHQPFVPLEAVGIALARERVGFRGLTSTGTGDFEQQRACPLGPLRLVGVAVAAGLFPTEQHAAHKRGDSGLACLVGAEHDVQRRAERTDNRVVETPEALQMQGAQVNRGTFAHRPSPPCSRRSSTKRVASSVRWRAFFSERAAVRGTLRARYSS